MKVICINEDNQNFFPGEAKDPVKIGEIYTVTLTRQSFIDRKYLVYELKEKQCAYWVGYFAPLNGPDEVSILEERQREEVKVRGGFEKVCDMLTEPAPL